ncbi:MAG: MFS transporter [Planctomycetota bacterium]|nr:MFS transporter [Planctomycetota bacterium]
MRDEERLSRHRKSTKRRLAYVTVTIVLGAIGSYAMVLPIFRDALQSYFGISIDQFGLLLSIGMVPGAAAVLVGGALIHRFGPRAVVRGALLGVSAGMCIAASGGGLWTVMILALVLVACFGQTLNIALQSFLVRLFPNRRRRVLSLNLVMGGAAGILYPLWAEFLLHLEQTSTRITFSHVLHVPFGVVAVLLFAGSFIYRRGTSFSRTGPKEATGDKWYHFRFSDGRWLLIALATLHGVCDSAAALWLPRVLGGDCFFVQTFAPGFVLAAAALAYVISRLILAALPEGMGTRIMLVAPGLLGGGVFIVGILLRTQAMTAAGFVLGSLLWSLEYPAILAMVAGKEHRRFGSALAIMTIATGVGTFLMVNLMGWMAAALGETGLWAILLIPAGGFPLVCLGGAVWLLRFKTKGGR